MLNLFEVPVALLTPLFRLGFHSFDPNKKTIAKKKKDNRKKKTRVRDAVAMSLSQCHTQVRANVTLYQAPVCASCVTVQVELVYSHVLKGAGLRSETFPSRLSVSY